MKFNIKGLYLILILLSASHISFSTEISRSNKRSMLKKTNTKNKFKFKNFSHKRASNKSKKRSKTNSKLSREDWLNPKDLLPVAFLKGVCSQFDSLEKVENMLDYTLEPEKLEKESVDFVCDKMDDKLVKGTFKKDEKEGEKKTKKKSKLKKFRAGDKATNLVANIFDDFKKCTGDAKIPLGNFVNNKQIVFPKDEINLIIAELKKPSNTKNIELKEQTLSFAILNDRKEYDILGTTQFLNIKKSVPNLSEEAAKELKYVHLNCLRDFVLDKILEVNKAESDVNKFIKLLDEKLKEDELYIEVSSVEKTNKIEQLKSKISTNDCINSLKKYYENKKKDLEEMEKTGKVEAPKNSKENQADLENILSVLTQFAYNFFKKVINCVSDSAVAEISQLDFKKLIEVAVNILSGLSTIKIIWHLGKFSYYLINAAISAVKTSAMSVIPGRKDESAEVKLKKAKRENAIEYGKAIGSLFNAVLSAIGLSRRKFRKGKKRLH